MSKPTLFLMLGYPGAGKTTIAEHIAAITGAIHLSSDNFRLSMFKDPAFSSKEHEAVYGALDYITELLLKNGVSVIYDANLNRYHHRQEKYHICQRTAATPYLIWVKTPENLSKERATVLGVHDPDHRPFGNLDQSVFERLAKEIEAPKTSEKVIEIDGQSVTQALIEQALAAHGIA